MGDIFEHVGQVVVVRDGRIGHVEGLLRGCAELAVAYDGQHGQDRY